MAIVQCPNNHYYDDKRSKSCPYCKKLVSLKVRKAEGGLNEQATSYIPSAEQDDNAQLTEGYGEAVAQYEKTIGIFTDESNNQLTAGWIVCISGAEKGKSYTVFSGRNFAGRSLEMDIVLSGDSRISREKHFSLVYDPKSTSFYLVGGSGNTYVNDKAVTSARMLREGDIIQAGESSYMFIPFCRKGREWK